MRVRHNGRVDTPDDPVVRLESELGLLLRRARASAERLARSVHPDLEPSAYPLLARIEREPDVRASELAEHIGVGRGTMSRQLGRMEQIGLIDQPLDDRVRFRPAGAAIGIGRRSVGHHLIMPAIHGLDLDDSRGQLIRVTPEGGRRVEAAREARWAYLGRVLESWSPQERELLADQMHRLNDSMTANPPRPAAPGV